MAAPRNPYAIGTLPPVGELPATMYAQVIREERFGEPRSAFQMEVVPVPTPGPGEVVVAVMAAGINYNNVWAALGYPLNVIAQRRAKAATGAIENFFHIGGSEASGIVYAVGAGVDHPRIGDEVVVHGGAWNPEDACVRAGGDPILAPDAKAWGYETNWGAFAQFCRVYAHQCLPRPPALSWTEAAAYILCGATAYRMLYHWAPNRVSAGDVVLVWGAAGGLGVMALQLVAAAGGVAIAVVGSEERGTICRELGAHGLILRTDFDIWGGLPENLTPETYGAWVARAERLKRRFLELSNGRLADVVFEHPGQNTIPLSCHLCAPGGMVVTCAATTGYQASTYLPDFVRKQIRLQGSHFANQDDCVALNQMIHAKKIRPVLARTFAFAETGEAHQILYENRNPPGNMVVSIGARE